MKIDGYTQISFPGFCYVGWDEGCWFRIFGYLVRFKGPREAPLFSERNGYKKPVLKAFGWRVFLGPKTTPFERT